LIVPRRVANATAPRMNTRVVPLGSTRMPPNIPAAATIEPTERSIPAVAITNVIPTAITPTTLAWVSMLRMLSQVGKLSGLRIAPATKRSTTTIASAYSWSWSPPSRPNLS
jgi:hypothetical protein